MELPIRISYEYQEFSEYQIKMKIWLDASRLGKRQVEYIKINYPTNLL